MQLIGNLKQEKAARLAALVTDPAYLESCERGQRSLVIQEVRLLDSAQRRALVQTVLTRPSAMVRVQSHAFSKLYAHCRAAAPDGALDVLGQLVQAFPDGNPDVARELKRRDFWAFGKLAWQAPDHFARLEQQYLVTADGRCCLPVAYLLAYGYGGEKRLGEWIDKLDARLAQATLTGDLRVNWLVARAMAEEVRVSRPERIFFPREPFLAGQNWLQEACLVAQSEPVRLRAYQQLTVRLVDAEQVEEATTLLDRAAARFSDPAAVAALAAWQTQITVIADRFHQQHAQDEAAAKNAYIQTLRSRRQRAIDRGNDQSAAQYEQRKRPRAPWGAGR